MPARRLCHSNTPPWTLACAAIFAALGAATTAPSSSPTGLDYGPTISLQYTNRENITTLVPLTQGATESNLGSSELFYTTDDNTANITDEAFAFISCDPSSYSGLLAADSVLAAVHDTKKPKAAIFYSTERAFCNYSTTDASLAAFPIYSTTNMTDAQFLKGKLTSQDAGTKFLALITRRGVQGDASNPTSQTPTNPLGPSPSTAVAMIILYSITGVITALFLVIIVTGAVRAHRHPDRYGPRDVMGRPRQSRARGLGMAILDTIPIVKFGEREQGKPADVELGTPAGSREVDVNANANGNANGNAETTATMENSTPQDAAREQQTPPEDTMSTEHTPSSLPSGIAPATGTPPPQTTPSPEDGALGCSICTDDFEKGQDIRVLPCDHKFHPECVDPWLLNVSGTCPLCRVDLRPPTPTSPSSSNPPPDASSSPASHEENRRHSSLRDVLSLRSRPNASTEERIGALRRLREVRREGEVGGSASSAGTEEAGRRRRSGRLSFWGGRRDEAGSAGENVRTEARTEAQSEEERR